MEATPTATAELSERLVVSTYGILRRTDEATVLVQHMLNMITEVREATEGSAVGGRDGAAGENAGQLPNGEQEGQAGAQTPRQPHRRPHERARVVYGGGMDEMEALAGDAADGELELHVVPKSDETHVFLCEALQEHYLFSKLDSADRSDVVDAMVRHDFEPGEFIIQQGDENGDLFYVLEHGSAEIWVDGVLVAPCVPGNAFGELALMYNSPRAASVRADDESVVWSISRRIFRRVLAAASEHHQTKLASFLSNVSLLSPLGEQQQGKIARALQIAHFSEGEYIIRQGELTDSFYMIHDGEVRCTRTDEAGNEHELIVLGPGEFFGERAILHREPRAANVIATGAVECYTLSRGEFTRLLGPLSELLADMMTVRVLQTVPQLRDASEDSLRAFAQQFTTWEAAQGTVIFQEGAPADAMYLIRQGSVSLTSTTAQKQAVSRKSSLIARLEAAGAHNSIAFEDVLNSDDEDEDDEELTDGVGSAGAAGQRGGVGTALAWEVRNAGQYFGEEELLGSSTRTPRRWTATVQSDGAELQVIPGNDLLAFLRRIDLESEAMAPSATSVRDTNSNAAVTGGAAAAAASNGTGAIQDHSPFGSGVRGSDSDDDGATAGDSTVAYVATAARKSSAILLGSSAVIQRSTACFDLTSVEPICALGEGTFGLVALVRDLQASSRAIGLVDEDDTEDHERQDQHSQPTHHDSAGSADTAARAEKDLARKAAEEPLKALKSMSKMNLVRHGQHQAVKKEKLIMSALCGHPFMTQYFGASEDAHQVHFLLEYVAGGELWAALYEPEGTIFEELPRHASGGIQADLVRQYMAILVEAMAHIHSKDFVYRDLKPENVLIAPDGYLKLCDFGFAKLLPYRKPDRSVVHTTFTMCGTPDYMAPEIVLCRGHDKGVDYWALGVLLFELLVGDTPFHGNDQGDTFRRIAHSQRYLKFPRHVDVAAKSLVRELLTPNSVLRLGTLRRGVDDIREHLFFAGQDGIDWQALREKRVPMVFRPGPVDPEAQPFEVSGAPLEEYDNALARECLDKQLSAGSSARSALDASDDLFHDFLSVRTLEDLTPHVGDADRTGGSRN